MNVRVPASDALLDVSRAVRHRSRADLPEEDLRAGPADDAEEDVLGDRPLEGDLESKPVPVERKRRGHVAHDEEWRDAGNRRSCHGGSTPRSIRSMPSFMALSASGE